MKFLTSDLGWQLYGPHSGPPAEEVVEKEKQTGVVVRVLACLSLARTVLFVSVGVVGLLRSQAKNVSRRLLAALVFPKQRKLLALLEVACLDAEFVVPDNPGHQLLPSSSPGTASGLGGAASCSASSTADSLFIVTRRGKELVLLPPDLSSPLASGATSRVDCFQSNLVLLCMALQHRPHMTGSAMLEPFYTRSLR